MLFLLTESNPPIAPAKTITAKRVRVVSTGAPWKAITPASKNRTNNRSPEIAPNSRPFFLETFAAKNPAAKALKAETAIMMGLIANCGI